MASALLSAVTPLMGSTECPVKVKDDSLADVATKLGETIRATEEKRKEDGLEPLTYRPVRMPMKFTAIEQEVNFLVTMSLLDFGSFYETTMKELTGKSVQDTLRMGCMGLFITNTKLDAEFMLNATASSIARAFSFPISKEVKVMDAVYQDEPGPLEPLAERIKRTFNEVGKVLRARQLESLGHFVMKAVTHANFKQSALALAQSLSEAFVGFRDAVEVNGVTCEFSRKACQAATDLFVRFGSEDERFRFLDMAEVQPSADSKLVYVLRQLGLLELDEKLRVKVDEQREELPASSKEEFYLRASALVTTQKLLQRLKEKGHDIDPYQLDAALRIAILENNQVLLADVCEHLTKSYHY